MPTGFMRSCQQKRGMYVPCSCATLINSSPGFASIVVPSMVTVKVVLSGGSSGGHTVAPMRCEISSRKYL